MKKLFCIALAAVAVALGGCETESSDNISVSISPNNVTMKKGESQTFTASGWRDYTWSLTDTSIGILSSTKGDSVIYTAVKSSTVTNGTLSQVIYVTVNIAADAVSSATNNVPGDTGNLVSSQALITHTYTP